MAAAQLLPAAPRYFWRLLGVAWLSWLLLAAPRCSLAAAKLLLLADPACSLAKVAPALASSEERRCLDATAEGPRETYEPGCCEGCASFGIERGARCLDATAEGPLAKCEPEATLGLLRGTLTHSEGFL